MTTNTTTDMTETEARYALEGLRERMRGYARLLVRTAARIMPGQELVLLSPVEAVDFARMVVAEAYEAGAGHVTMRWKDDEINHIEYEHCPLEYYQSTPSWEREQLDSLAQKGAAFIFLEGTNPHALDGIDPAKPAARSKAQNLECKIFRNGLDFGHNVWCIAGVPTQAWAETVFPELKGSEALYRLWRLILEVARAAGEDPESAWQTHNSSFEQKKQFLNDLKLDELHYRSSNGTDLKIGLTKKAVWEGGAMVGSDGRSFFPNIPTEEVFSTPDRMRAEGIVYSALPLIHAGQLVRDFWLRFEAGRVVDYGAEQGKDVLKHIIETDENAGRLGELALVSKNTPIRQSGKLFYSTLYDENASCHLALGKGFPECYENGSEMSVEELLAVGVNDSATHVDFMIGSDDLSIIGRSQDGTEHVIFENGQWVWE